ncbi:hypothetical protein FE394_12515 [Xenorhabdus sp. Reich]|uniref:Uncharacterized protein n=1 Tax=Xenorhabdus littoralis TaxID=2582835 RepID=A0ABU4SMX2_9GAMM|nr:hypothetical protein [Xenorhabdus sp. Reich]MDX8000003.1 hypothetical protein [Xenorhabdus sp. Reich]
MSVRDISLLLTESRLSKYWDKRISLFFALNRLSHSIEFHDRIPSDQGATHIEKLLPIYEDNGSGYCIQLDKISMNRR